jgi:hypothetical protein
VSTPPGGVDPFLPQRLRSEAIVTEGEQQVGRAWFRSMTRWTDRFRGRVTGGEAINPGVLRSAEARRFWTTEVDQRVVPAIGNVLSDVWRRVTRRGDPETDLWTSAYLNEAGNRMRRIPDEVYALVVARVEAGIRDGDDLDTVAADIDTILTATGSERWPNRAMVVARTETLGAVNAGAFRSAQLEAEARGDVAPAKVWIATADPRTRPTHREADKQRTLLDSPFRVGGHDLMFPGDPQGPAQEVIQCRCSLLPVVLGETLDWTDRQNPTED